MPTFTLTFNATLEDLNDFCEGAGYSEWIRDGINPPVPNTETKANFFKRMVKEFAISNVRAARIKRSTEAAAKIEKDKVINLE